MVVFFREPPPPWGFPGFNGGPTPTKTHPKNSLAAAAPGKTPRTMAAERGDLSMLRFLVEAEALKKQDQLQNPDTRRNGDMFCLFCNAPFFPKHRKKRLVGYKRMNPYISNSENTLINETINRSIDK